MYPDPVARRFYELTEPVALVAFFSQEPADAMAALGYRGYSRAFGRWWILPKDSAG